MDDAPGKNKRQKAAAAAAPATPPHLSSGADAGEGSQGAVVAADLAGVALTLICRYCRELLEKHGASLPDECREYVHRIARAAEDGRVKQGDEKIRGSAADLLEVSSDASPCARASVDLGEISKAIVSGLMLTRPERRIKFISAVCVTADGDEKLLRIALRNLLNVAWRKTSSQEETVIELGITDHAGERVYFIRDNGPGCDPAHIEEALNSPSCGEEIDLNGFGLDTAARIIRNHGGRIWVDASAEVGSALYFTI